MVGDQTQTQRIPAAKRPTPANGCQSWAAKEREGLDTARLGEA